MRLVKIGMANLNTTVGAFESNTRKVIDYMGKMKKARCSLGCFHEQVIPGYPCEDLVQWSSFVKGQQVYLEQVRIASVPAGDEAPTVFIVGITREFNGNIYNALAVVCNGKVWGIVPKEKLPTYGIFYDGRTFSRGIPGKVDFVGEEKIPFGDLLFEFPFGIIGLEVCEDIWSPDGPMRRRAYSGAEIIVNASASPFRIGISDTRKELISTRASDNQVTLVYVNQFGGNDSLVFDGGAYINQNGHMMETAPRWIENFSTYVIDLNRTTRLRHENTTWRTDCEIFMKENEPVKIIAVPDGPRANLEGYKYCIPPNKSFFIPSDTAVISRKELHYEDLINALVTGLDYYVKTGAFKKIGIALSGGKDSVLSLALSYLFAKKYFKDSPSSEEDIRRFVHCFSMPSRFNSGTTRGISAQICEDLGVTFKEIPIQEAFEKELEVVKSMLTPGEEVTPITLQNIQARIRGERMLNWANSSGGMWIQTGNMSEKAVGYTTVGGDMMGAYSLIANLPKTLVIDLLDYLCKKYRWKGIDMVLNTNASAELAEDQEDERDLMPFPVLDAAMYLFVEEKKSPRVVYDILQTMWSEGELKEMFSAYRPGLLKEWVKRFVRLFHNSIFKWVQTPQAVHVGKLELDRERALQLPVVQSKEWEGLDDF